MDERTGLPVAGYVPQAQGNIDIVNENKAAEEVILRMLDALDSSGKADGRWLAVARTHLETGFMAMNRAVFKPSRVKLQGDD